MTTTTTTPAPSVTCSYCSYGKVWGGSVLAPERTCMVCKGSGRLAPLACATCAAPLLDGQAKRWFGPDTFHKGC